MAKLLPEKPHPLTLDEMIASLQEIRKKHGSMNVRIQTIHHIFPPAMTIVLDGHGKPAYLLLND